jgi:uncharacterized protein
MTAPRGKLIVGDALTRGRVTAPLISLAEPLSFWGGFDAATGKIIDHRHPDLGRCLSGAIVRMTAARGSSSGSSVLAEAIRTGTAPAGFIVRERDAILLLAALVADELYGKPCVIVQLDKSRYDALNEVGRVGLIADQGPQATIEILSL